MYIFYDPLNDYKCRSLLIFLQVEVIDGGLQCPESGRTFPIQEGIPNMLLREDEV